MLAAPLRRLGAAGLLAGTGLSANRWRTAALATPIVLVTMLVGIQGVVESSNQRHTADVTRERVTADAGDRRQRRRAAAGGHGRATSPASTASPP